MRDNDISRNQYIQEDYVHSANSLFHFMSSPVYLKKALIKKALCPRYCVEDIRYLGIESDNGEFPEIAVLQKCFCDIPLRNISKNFPVELTNNNGHLTEQQRGLVPKAYSHTELYGNYALAFSKKWGEESKLQPMHYLSDYSECSTAFSKMINVVLSEEDVLDIVSDTMIDWLCYFKPLRGAMKRKYKDKEYAFDFEIHKNFHDEHEWRYVPLNINISGVPLDCVLANKNILEFPQLIKDMNDRLETDVYREAWMHFQYDDIKYIIVPDNDSRVDIINTIMTLEGEKFESQDVAMKKNILVSKIMVLGEIMKDF